MAQPDAKSANATRDGAGLAQLVEHLICNQGARGSNPLAGTMFSNSREFPRILIFLAGNGFGNKRRA